MRTPKPPGKVGSKVESKRRSKLLEPPKEPPRPKTHWDHVLEEMAWLAKDFESERKWKLSHAKRVAHKVIRNGVDQASREELRLKEEEQRVRRLAGNIAKEVRKFWMKIEKLVHYKHQRDLEERRKRARDKQLNFLLGQTERYSTMLAENLVEKSQMLEPSKEPIENCQNKPVETDACLELAGPSLDDQLEEDAVCKEASFTYLPGETRTNADSEDEFSLGSTGDMEDDEATLEADEALITEDERNAELTALKDECDLPLEEILKRYAQAGGTGEATDSEGNSEEYDEYSEENCSENDKEKCTQATSYLDLPKSELRNEAELIETENAVAEEMKPEFNINDDEVKTEDSSREIHLLVDLTEGDQAEVQTCRELASETRTADEPCVSNDAGEIYESVPDNYQSIEDNFFLLESENELDDGEYTSAAVAGEDEDDEATLLEEEELAEVEGNDVTAEIDALKAESELPVEILVQRYRRTDCLDSGKSDSQDEKKPDFESVEALPVDMANDTKENEGKLLLIPEEDNHGKISEVKQKSRQTDLPHEIEEEESNDVKIADAAAAARLAQPTGNTFSTTKVRTKLPFLLKHPLREYQHIGLDWLVTMYEKRLNGILADEMGLGKTIMTIALLAHLACEKGIWGPHLIVVPTSVMLNWETEFMKWCPAFKVLTYFGSAKERKVKRQGWAKLNSFHVCITTYRLVIQDAKAFKRKKWKYLILDEAHLIKNWKSQRWQTLLNFNSKRRILLTGTPLQNDLMELWSLMHFLMPHLFQSQQEFKDWFSNPIAGMVERQEQVNKEVVDRLHNVLRPFILRRLKQDVEKQLPKKYEHVIACKLSKRQRNLYEDFIASSETQATLASGNFLGLINVLMQLRKVCNHPDLFEGRPIVSSFDMIGSEKQVHPSICSVLGNSQHQGINLVGMNLVFTHLEFRMSTWEYDEVSKIATPSALIQEIRPFHRQEPMHRRNIFEEIQQALHDERVRQARARAMLLAWLNSFRCKRKPVYGMDLRKAVTIEHPVFDIHKKNESPAHYLETSSLLADLVLPPSQRCRKMLDMIESFVFAIPAARAPQPVFWCSKSASSALLLPPPLEESTAEQISNLLEPLRPVIVRRQLFFPDRRLIQFDCGKLQELAILLRRLKSEGHRALIFTQMTKMLDVLEAFINLYGYTYVRLDGSTQPEERQILMQRFNTNPKIFLFILSTRSGGVGINLVGADTVIFYDSDWNPAMDQQAQDRCHRIGQTREVHIYRLVSEKTIEENILKKANQKRALDDLVIQSGGYNTEFFKKLNPMDLFSGLQGMRPKRIAPDGSDPGNEDDQLLSNDDLEAALKNAEDEADYMALKKVELEDAAHDQEFTEDVVTRLLEDDEYGIEPDEGKSDVKKAQDDYEQTENRAEKLLHSTENEFTDNNTALHPVDSEIEMMVDVQQMGTGAGNGALSFQDRLLPVEKYAIQFLEEWDPIVDKAALESQMRFEEAEWELDRLEKMKEEQEAEIDEDDEPLLYESWDTEFANETYRQQVEVLAQQQLLQDQLEWDSEEAAALDDDGGEARRALKQKARHKLKKTKFKSLKRGNLALNEDQVNDKMSAENNFSESGDLHGSITAQRKRKALKMFEDEVLQGSHLKKMRKKHATGDLELMDIDDLGDGHGDALQNELFGSTSRGGKIIISDTPTKKVAIIKLDNRKKKSSRKDKNRLPSPYKWSTSEDAILCAIVHEYGINWELASFILYGITSGGMYRGRYRHPIHCRERFGELFLTFISSATAESNSEKANMSLKTLLRVTEEHVKKLFDVVQELPDNDFLLQRHFAAVLSSVSRHRGATRTKTQDRLVSNGHPVTSSSHSISVQNNLLNGHWVTDENDSWLRSTPQLAVRNGSGESRAADLVGAALQETREETKDPLSKKATSSDGISDPACTSGIGPISVSSTDQLLIDLKFEQPSVFSDNRDQSVTVVVYRADNLSEDRSEDIVKESAYAGNFIRSREDMIPAVEPHSLGKHSPPTELVKPVPKKPRLLDLNQMISEADAGLLDMTVGEADSDVIEDAVPDDRTHLLSELRNIMNPEFEESFSENRDYDFAGFMTASMEPSVSYSKREIIPDLPDIF